MLEVRTEKGIDVREEINKRRADCKQGALGNVEWEGIYIGETLGVR